MHGHVPGDITLHEIMTSSSKILFLLVLCHIVASVRKPGLVFHVCGGGSTYSTASTGGPAATVANNSVLYMTM